MRKGAFPLKLTNYYIGTHWRSITNEVTN